MRAFLLFLLGAVASADTSRRGTGADPRGFSLIKKIPMARASLLSPAGTHFAIYSGNNVELHEIGKAEAVTLRGHTQNIHDGGWSRDGRVLATSGYDGAVRVWDVRSGREILTVTPHTGYA
mgnify:CR=1 FL=1